MPLAVRVLGRGNLPYLDGTADGRLVQAARRGDLGQSVI